MKRNRKARGFSLLESLTSLAVLSIIMSALMNNYSTGLRGVDKSGERMEATILARSLIAEATGTDIVIPGSKSGKAGNLTWQVNTSVYEKGKSTVKNKAPKWSLYRVRIIIKKQRKVLTSLETLKIGKIRDQKL